MANNKLLLIGALGATVLLALFLFTRDGVQPDRKAPRAEATHAVQKAVGHKKKAMHKKKKKNRAARRAAFLKRWEKMPPEKQAVFRKNHPRAKLPAPTEAELKAKEALPTTPEKEKK